MSSERASVVKRKLQHRGINGDGRPPDWTMAVTATCRDARMCQVGGRPLSNDLDDVTFNGDGRSDRASLQDLVTASIVVLTGTDAQTERPYRIQSRLASWY